MGLINKIFNQIRLMANHRKPKYNPNHNSSSLNERTVIGIFTLLVVLTLSWLNSSEQPTNINQGGVGEVKSNAARQDLTIYRVKRVIDGDTNEKM